MNTFEVVIRGSTNPIWVDADRIQNVPGYVNFTTDDNVVALFNENDVIYVKIVETGEDEEEEEDGYA